VPERVCKIIDEAIQMYGATGVSQWTPLSRMYASQRTLRLADGPDEVHWGVVGRFEIARYENEPPIEKPTEYRGMFAGPA
jgi:acyl-CoA dehydrogenase